MRRILQASAIMGLSSVVTVGLSALRYKVLALNIGAEGIGVLGLFSTMLALGVTLFGMGLGSSGIRQVAASQADKDGLGLNTHHALSNGSWLLGLFTIIVGLLLFPLLQTTIFSDAPALLIIWLVIAVAASVVSSGQIALLNGLGRLPEIAKANIFGSVIGTSLTLLFLYVMPDWALAAAFASSPIVILLITTFYTQLIHIKKSNSILEQWNAFKPMLIFGLAFSGSILLSNVSQVMIRLIVDRRLGLDNVGYYQAAWTIANVYLGFIITAMAAEYFPRISAIAHDTKELNQQVNTQIRLLLLISTPIIFLLVFFTPIIMSAMYAADFAQANVLLRWQLLGDILKIASWPVGFLLLARESKRVFFVSEFVWNAVFISLSFVFLSLLGLKGLGLAYGCAYLAYFILILTSSYRLTGYVIENSTVVFVSLSLSLGFLAEILSSNQSSLALLGKILILFLIFVLSFFLLGLREIILRLLKKTNFYQSVRDRS